MTRVGAYNQANLWMKKRDAITYNSYKSKGTIEIVHTIPSMKQSVVDIIVDNMPINI